MRKLFGFIAVGALALGLSTPAIAAPYAFTATLSVTVGTFPPVTGTAAGVGTSVSGGGAASIPGSVFSVGATAQVSPPLLGLIGGFAVCGAGLGSPIFNIIPPSVNAGTCLPNASGTNGVLSWSGGPTGTMPLLASAYLTGTINAMGQAMAVAAIPLAVIGVGGTQGFSAFGGLVAGTVTANPWQLAAVTQVGVLNGATTVLTGVGFDARNGAGIGTLQLVTPTDANIVVGNLPAIATLTISYIPEPGTILLLGAGVAGLAVAGRRRMSK